MPQAGDPWDDEAVSTDVFRGTAGRSRVLYQLRRNQFRRDKLIIYQNWASALCNLIKMTLSASLFFDRIILLDLFLHLFIDDCRHKISISVTTGRRAAAVAWRVCVSRTAAVTCSSTTRCVGVTA